MSETLIDWEKLDQLRMRDSQPVRSSPRVVAYHKLPAWMTTLYPHVVNWSDGRIFYYNDYGMSDSQIMRTTDVVMGPRCGEGWIYPDLPAPTIYNTQQDDKQIHVKWEEVVK